MYHTFLQLCICYLETELNLDPDSNSESDPELITDPDPNLHIISGPAGSGTGCTTLLGIEPGSFMTGSKRVDHFTSGTVYECSEIAGSPQIGYAQPSCNFQNIVYRQ